MSDRDIATLRDKAQVYRTTTLDPAKESINPRNFSWYPYDTMVHFDTLDRLLTGNNRTILDQLSNKTIVDIGGADGDLSFFFESLGYTVQFIDNPPTNYYGMQGVRALKKALNSDVSIYEMDIDDRFVLPERQYDLAFMLNVLYHLKNPYYVLETLAKSVRYCFLSTKIAQFSPDMHTYMEHLPVAYLLYPGEANNDPSNYWVFTDTGFRRLLDRTGWEVLDYMRYGNLTRSDPASQNGDERAICLVKSRIFGSEH